MPDLAFLIDNMRCISMPNYFTHSESVDVLHSITLAKEQARPYQGHYKASWLLTPFESATWITRNQGREEFINGEWVNALNVHWNVILPNGVQLIDLKYQTLLDVNKKHAWLIRSGLVGEITAPNCWRAGITNNLLLTRWLVLNESRYSPDKFAFKLIDQNGINSLFRSLAIGGWFQALQIPSRIVNIVHKEIFGYRCQASVYNDAYDLPPDLLKIFIEWLYDNKYFITTNKGPNKGKQYINKKMVAELVHEPHNILAVGNKSSLFFRQFEKDYSSVLLYCRIQKTELPDQYTKTITESKEVSVTENTQLAQIRNIERLLAGHRQLPQFIPEPRSISLKQAKDITSNLTHPSSHHLFIPVNTGLKYLNKAIQIVHIYGEAVVSLFLAVVKRDYNEYSMIYKSADESLNNIYNVVVGHDIISTCKVFGISVFRKSVDRFNFTELRSNPSLEEALEIVIGACIVCIAIMKPSRECELTHLKRNCLKFQNGGYLLNFTLGKSHNQNDEKPIPLITVKAIKLLQKLGSAICELTGDKRKISENLFYIPNIKDGEVKKANASLLNHHLDVFCDYVALPADQLGRRWYIRIHEMRKWFLLLLFWSGRYNVLDAARWVAGHTDVKHIYDYIERELPGSELPLLEAEYAVSRLREIDETLNMSEPDNGLLTLYQLVLDHFQIQSLSMVPDNEWIDYIESLRTVNGFHLEPHSIYCESDQVVGVNISFVLRESFNE